MLPTSTLIVIGLFCLYLVTQYATAPDDVVAPVRDDRKANDHGVGEPARPAAAPAVSPARTEVIPRPDMPATVLGADPAQSTQALSVFADPRDTIGVGEVLSLLNGRVQALHGSLAVWLGLSLWFLFLSLTVRFEGNVVAFFGIGAIGYLAFSLLNLVSSARLSHQCRKLHRRAVQLATEDGKDLVRSAKPSSTFEIVLAHVTLDVVVVSAIVLAARPAILLRLQENGILF